MKTIQDIDKIKQAIEDGLLVFEDIKKAMADDGKVSLIEGSVLVIKHGGKALRLIGTIKEIGDEITDLDGDEAKKLVELFGTNEESKQAISDIAQGSGLLNQGIQKLIELRKGS
jgi:hypothetical protein